MDQQVRVGIQQAPVDHQGQGGQLVPRSVNYFFYLHQEDITKEGCVHWLKQGRLEFEPKEVIKRGKDGRVHVKIQCERPHTHTDKHTHWLPYADAGANREVSFGVSPMCMCVLVCACVCCHCRDFLFLQQPRCVPMCR
jgi:hypothetical protein